MGFMLTVISCVRGRRLEVFLNRLDKNLWEVLEIYSSVDIKGVRNKDSLLINWWEGA